MRRSTHSERSARKYRGRVLAAGFACLVLLLQACGKDNGPPAQPAVPVVAARVEQKTVPMEITTIGTVEAYNTVSVNSRVGGEITRVFFEEGQDVGQDAPLFQIDPAPYRAALEGARAVLARDSVRAWNAGENVRRYAEL
ncbi:MAG: biotin/lipoyl-binding protein, partial [Candidatus Glassbacteria bacterium]|nr:biotin/lipoyl-binding protein [Candidatus Glassbacteria bacterium]